MTMILMMIVYNIEFEIDVIGATGNSIIRLIKCYIFSLLFTEKALK